MASHVRWGRLIRIAAVAILAPIICLIAAVRIQQYVLRWRAEQLLADIRQIQMGKSTWADAQRLMHRWGKWGRWEGSCDARSCDYQIAMQDASNALPTFFFTQTDLQLRSEKRDYSRWQLRLYSILGGRVAQVYAEIRIKNGIIWTKAYTVQTPRDSHEMGTDDLLIGTAEGTTHLNPDDWPIPSNHPEFQIRAAGPCEGCNGGCTICELIQTRVTPFADPGAMSQLFEFNLACISSWRECEEPREIMPSAWRLFRQDKTGRGDGSVDWPICKVPVDVIARDYQFGVLTEVNSVKSEIEKDGWTRYVASLSLLESVKNDTLKGRDQLAAYLKRVRLGWSDTMLAGGVPASSIRPGDRMFLFFNRMPSGGSVDIDEDFCSYVLDTEQNRAAIARGIARDALSDPN